MRAAIPLLVAALFAAWTWTLVLALLDIRRRGLALRGGWPGGCRDGPASEWRGLAAWRRDPGAAPRRRRLAGLSLALVALVVLWEVAFDAGPSPSARP